MNSRLSFLVIGIFLLLFGATTSNAQSLLEKSLVAKSKLHNSIWLKNNPSSTFEVNHDAWDRFLSTYTKKTSQGIRLVSYSRVKKADRQDLKSYINYLQSIDVANLNRNEQYAFWLNLYNASIVNTVLENLPVSSVLEIKSNPLDLKGPFNDTIAEIYGLALTPDTIESGIVRPIWKDARLHYGFNCAAISCPNLFPVAFRGGKVQAQLEDAARAYINDPRGIHFNNEKLTASKIFFWYSEDYGNSDVETLTHIRRYARPDLAAKLAGLSKIDRFEYDWSLNGQ